MADRPLLFLDVDGVINALDQSLPVSCTREGFPIRFQPWIRECLADLHEHFTVVWMTTWQEKAEPSFAEVLGLPDPPREHVSWSRLKIPHMLDFAGDRRWAYADDEARYEGTHFLREEPHTAGLIHEPDPRVGLTREGTHLLVAYAEELARAAT